MKKIIAATFLLLCSETVHALPVGNPMEATLFFSDSDCCSDPGLCNNAWSIRLGFYGDYVFDRNLKVDASGTNVNDRNILTTQIFTSAGYFALNICDRMDIFTTLGTSHLFIRTNTKALGTITDFLNGVMGEFDFETSFSWSVGARSTVWNCGCLNIGVEGQYFQTKPDIEYILYFDTGTAQYISTKRHTHYREWQVGLGAAYRLATCDQTFSIVPYTAVTWSNAKLFTDDPRQEGIAQPLFLRDLESQRLWGYAVGVSFTFCNRVQVTLEGRYAVEKALYANGQFRF